MATTVGWQGSLWLGVGMAHQDLSGGDDEAVVVALLGGSLHRGVEELPWGLDEVVEHGDGPVTVDLSQVHRLGPSTLGVLLWASRQCRARGRQMLVRNPPAAARELISRTRLKELVEVRDAN